MPGLIGGCLWYCAVVGHGVERDRLFGDPEQGDCNVKDGLKPFQPRVTADSSFIGKLLITGNAGSS
jgi:hypothetical protein